MVFKPIEQKFFTFEAITITGTIEDIASKLNEVNNDRQRQLVFLSNIVAIGNSFSAIIQIKKFR